MIEPRLELLEAIPAPAEVVSDRPPRAASELPRGSEPEPVAVRPRLLIVGGVDVDKRLDLMKALSARFAVSAAGSNASLSDRFDEASFPYFTYPLTRGRSPIADLQSLVLLRWLYRFCRPDIVHTFATKPCVWGRLAARAADVPVVVGTLPGLGVLYASESLTTRATRQVYERLQRAACRASDMTVFQNERDVKQFRQSRVVTLGKSTVIHGSGVNTGRYRRDVVLPEGEGLRREFGWDADVLVVTMIARLIRSKGVLDFAAAARLLGVAYGDRVRFVLVGPLDHDSVDGLRQSDLESLGPHLTWLGERRDVPSILASSDVFVLPSWYREGVPRVLMEAASMGLPLVSTRTPGCEDVVKDGTNGFLVPPRSPADLAQAIQRLLDDADLRARYGHASRKLAVDQFDLTVVARITASLYGKLLAAKSASRRASRT